MVNKKIIEHINNIYKWDKLQINNPKTLVIGSFNPYNPNLTTQTEFYYSRIQNRFWSTIGNLKYNNQNFFNHSLKKKIDEIHTSKFIFMDLIESIEFRCENEYLLEKYINDNVFKNFGDSDIWVSKKRTNPPIYLRRNYNQRIIQFLSDNNTVKRIVNTLGKNKGDLNSFNKREKNWSEFQKSLFKISKQKKIEIVNESVSPSPLGCSQKKLDSWIKSFVLSN